MIPQPATPNQLKRLISGKPPQEEFVQSASQVDTFIGCEKDAGLVYIDGHREIGQNDAVKVGERVHAILQAYVETGAKPDLNEVMIQSGEYNGTPWSRKVWVGQIADVAICLIPREGATAEKPLNMLRPNGIRWTGPRDLRVARVLHDGRHMPEVRDYKTTSDFKYMEDKDLATDTQAQVYACAEFDADPTLQELLLHWQFLRTKGKPDSKSLYFVCSRAHNALQMERIDAAAARWVALRKRGARDELRGADLEPTGLEKGTCDKYFGCPHRGTRCVVSTQDLLKKSFGGSSMSSDINALIANMTNRQGALTGIPAPAGFVPAPAAPVAAPVAQRPAFWMPGDPLNIAQQYFQGQGKDLFVIALAADNPPPEAVAKSYLAPVTPSVINAPEAPAFAPVNPESAAALSPVVPAATPAPAPEGDERAALKAQAVARGLVGAGSKLGADKLRALLASGVAEVTNQAPVTFAPGQQTAPIDFGAGLSGSVALVPAPAPVAIPAPASNLITDLDAFAGKVADLIAARLKAALVSL
jgi:hypothetical protein